MLISSHTQGLSTYLQFKGGCACSWFQCFHSSCRVMSLCCFWLSLSQFISTHFRSNSPQAQCWSRVEASVFNAALSTHSIFPNVTFPELTRFQHCFGIHSVPSNGAMKTEACKNWPHRKAGQDGDTQFFSTVQIFFIPEENQLPNDTLGWLAFNLIS